jgi:hypothetical protein
VGGYQASTILYEARASILSSRIASAKATIDRHEITSSQSKPYEANLLSYFFFARYSDPCARKDTRTMQCFIMHHAGPAVRLINDPDMGRTLPNLFFSTSNMISYGHSSTGPVVTRHTMCQNPAFAKTTVSRGCKLESSKTPAHGRNHELSVRKPAGKGLRANEPVRWHPQEKLCTRVS